MNDFLTFNIKLISRTEAKALGLTRYFTGKPCPKGHICEKRVSNFNCIQCQIDGLRIYQKGKGRTKQSKISNKYISKRRKIDLEFKRKCNKSSYLSACKRRKNNINCKISQNLRSRLNIAIRNNYKSGSAVKDLGCDITFFKNYIEEQFKYDMTWDNWGTVWHLDHIKPLSLANLSVREEFLEVVNYTNLQPLYVKDNIIKGNKFEPRLS